jgi:tetratricopeptide (TPR) repeat protein
MEKLEPPHTHFVSAALGWLELGNPAEALAELDRLEAELQGHPDVLEVRWLVYAAEARWEEGLRVARDILACAPERSSGWLHQAYALRRVPEGSVKHAWDALLPAFDKFPRVAIISYNLSCYACQMKQLEAARTWLKRALVIGGKDRYKHMALEDKDLEALWQEIPAM